MFAYYTGKDKLVSSKADGWYSGYNEDTGRWEELIQKPVWWDEYTRGCAHPDGVLLAGAKNHNTGNHVVLLNLRAKQLVPLPGKSCDVRICFNNIYLHIYFLYNNMITTI